MIKALSLAAALALAVSAPAFAQEVDTPSFEDVCSSDSESDFADMDEDLAELDELGTPSVQELQTAAKAFGDRMKSFDANAKAICGQTALSDTDKQARIETLWSQYEPEVNAFVALAARLGPAIAAEALSQVDVAAITSEAMAEVQASGALQGAMGVARNSAWTSGDPEHMATLGLMANYALGEAMDEAESDADEVKEAEEPAEPAPAPSAD